jgi:ferredoxin
MSTPEEPTGPPLRVVRVDLARCVGHGKCYAVAPELMRPFDDEGHSEFYADPIEADDAKRIALGKAAIESCPEFAPAWRPYRPTEDD